MVSELKPIMKRNLRSRSCSLLIMVSFLSQRSTYASFVSLSPPSSCTTSTHVYSPHTYHTSLTASPSTSESSSSITRKKPPSSVSDYGLYPDPKIVEQDMARLCRTGRFQEAHSLYWSIWELDDNNTSKGRVQVKPTTKLMNHAIGVCSRSASSLVSEAFHIFNHGISGGKKGIRRLSPNVYTFGSLMSVCARVGDVQKCLELLKSMKDQYGITPNAVIYSTAISACERSLPPQPKTAIELLKKATANLGQNNNMDGVMSVVGYNAALSVLARVGDWKSALQLLDEMEGQSSEQARRDFIQTWNLRIEDDVRLKKPILDPQLETPVPDNVSYGTVMAACERAGQWHQVLRLASVQEELSRLQMSAEPIPMDGMALTSALHACQQLGLADEALHYLNLMKTLKSPSPSSMDELNSAQDHRRSYGRRSPLKGPDSVAYHLAISAIARSISIQSDIPSSSSVEGMNNNSTSRWTDGIRLLREMEAVSGSPPDVIAFTAAIGCCAEAGEWKRAFSLLNEMQTSRYHLQPNVMTYSTVISSCANALAKITDSKEKKVILGAALQLLETMKESKYPESQPNIVSYNAAIRTCAEAQDLEGAFRLMDEVISRGLTPTIVTFGSLMTACERVGSVDDMNLVFELLNQFNENRLDTEQIKPNEIIYGAAISCCRKAAQSDRAVQLLKKMIKAGLSPNTATFNTVIMALTEGKYPDIDKALSVFKVMNSQNCTPNRQTFNVIIRSLAASQRPADAEVFLTNMSTAGFTPDVDLYTITVTCYEKNREPMKALQLMESMRERGYDFYDIKVVNEAFKKAIKLVNVVGRRFS